MCNPLFKAPDGGRFEILWKREDLTQSELPLGAKIIRASRLEGSPRSLSDRLTHARMDKFYAISGYIRFYLLIGTSCNDFHHGLDMIIPDDDVPVIKGNGRAAMARNDLNLVSYR